MSKNLEQLLADRKIFKEALAVTKDPEVYIALKDAVAQTSEEILEVCKEMTDVPQFLQVA